MSDNVERHTNSIIEAIACELSLTGPESYPTLVAILGRYTGAMDRAGLLVPSARLRAFATECVEHGDMTPAAARMLNRILDGE